MALIVVVALVGACPSSPSHLPDLQADLPSRDGSETDATGGDGAPPDLSHDAPRDLLDAMQDATQDQSAAGSFSALTYNIAGIPFGISKSDPDKNTPLISPLLNPFDLVLIQEDFTYYKKLTSKIIHPYKSVPVKPPILLSDGLDLFAHIPFKNLTRIKWIKCNGIVGASFDCLAAKGFLVAEVSLAPGVVVHVYDVHLDAGRDQGDHVARKAQVDQLLKEITARSTGQAIIVGGDTNLRIKYPDDKVLLAKLLNLVKLTDACQALSCGDDRYDRIMFRSSSKLLLSATSWKVDKSFVDNSGKDLSDHEALVVSFTWQVLP